MVDRNAWYPRCRCAWRLRSIEATAGPGLPSVADTHAHIVPFVGAVSACASQTVYNHALLPTAAVLYSLHSEAGTTDGFGRVYACM